MLMNLKTVLFPTNKEIVDIVGYIPEEIGNEKVLTLSIQNNVKGKWISMTWTRFGSTIIQNINKKCWEIKCIQ